LVTESKKDEIDAAKPSTASDNILENQMGQTQVKYAMIQLVELSSTTPQTVNLEAPKSEVSSNTKIPCQKFLSKQIEITENKKETLNVSEDVKPFTEQQLTSLYQNQELALVDAFVIEFTETQLRCMPVRQQHRLHELLMSYLRVRNHLIANSYELERLKKNCRETQKQLWCLEKTSVTENGECQDGNPVSATHEYSIAHFNQQTLVALSRTLSAIKETLHESQALYCYEAESLRLQIEHYIQRVSRSSNVSCIVLSNCSPDITSSLFLGIRKSIAECFGKSSTGATTISNSSAIDRAQNVHNSLVQFPASNSQRWQICHRY